MSLNRKTAIPVILILLAFAAAGGWFLLQKQKGEMATNQLTTTGKQLYTCSMHPFIIKERPGLCPVCGMELIKKTENVRESAASSAAAGLQAEMPGHVVLSQNQRVMANVATMEVKTEILNREIRAVGIVQYDQSRQSRVTAWIDGRIEKLYVGSAGALVTREKPIAVVYSPDLLEAQQEYLLAIKGRSQMKNSSIPSIAEHGDALAAAAKQRLMLLGVRSSRIAALEKTGKPDIRLPVYSPFSGVVIEKMVQQGQYVKTGDVLFNIADLSRVWVEIDVYENEIQDIHTGQQVEIRSGAFPDFPVNGRISLIYPFLDPKTRTARARVEVANTELRLKPDMFVNAIIKVPTSPAIVVPVTALIDTGRRQVVWVESSPGMFEPRTVRAGQQSNGNVQILSGLNPGDNVAVSGAYLIDSESQLKGSAAGNETMPGMKMDERKASPSGEGINLPAARQPMERKGSMDTMNMK